MDAAPILYGIQSGTFRRNGLDVVFQKANSGSAVAAAVAAARSRAIARPWRSFAKGVRP